MKIALDPYMLRGVPLLELPAVVAGLGYEYIELSPREDFTPFFLHPRADRAAVAELNGGVLRALVGVVDHALRSSHRERHVQGVEHQPGGEGRSHRPADDPTAARIKHHCQVEKAGPGWNVLISP